MTRINKTRLILILTVTILSSGVWGNQNQQARILSPFAMLDEATGSQQVWVDPAVTDTLLEEGFENPDTYGFWSYVDQDGDGNSWSIYVEAPPPDTVAHSGIHGIGVYYNSSGNDDWLISPQLTLPAGQTSTLSLWAHSYSASFLEDFNVKLSTGGSTVSDFTITLGSETGISADWTEYSYDLTDYAGSDVYFAIQCVSVDEWYLFADDILVTTSGPIPLAADFSVNVQSGTAPLTVQFIDASTGDITTWSWDFGDGETADIQNPSHTYTIPGNYTVTLQVGDGISTDSYTAADLITVMEPGGTTESYWSTLHPLPSATTIYDAQFLNSTNGFACGENEHVFRTTDGGTTWEVMNLGDVDNLRGLDFPSASTGYAVGNNGSIYKTTDGGETVISISLDSYDDYRDVGFVDENTGYIVGNNGVLLQTTDGGMNWTELDVTDVGLYTIVFLNSSVGFIGAHDGLILKTTDAGETWTESRSADNGENFYAIYFLNDNTGWAVGGRGAIFKTTDGGGSWTDQSVNTSDSYEGVYFVDDQTGYALRDHHLDKTTDGGTTWESLFFEAGYYMQCLAFATNDHAQAFARGGHIFNTDDQWDTYTQNSLTGRTLRTVDFWDTEHGVVAGDGGVILTTTDRGATWSFTEVNHDVNAVQFLDANTVIATCSWGEVIKSTDGGFTWENIETDAVPYEHYYGFSAPEASTFYAVGSDGAIVKSTDGGESWEAQTSGTEEDLNAVFFSSTQHGVAVGGPSNVAVILKTDDGGTNWSAITSPVTEGLNSVYFLNDNTGFAVGQDKALITTTDGGANWAELTLTDPPPTDYFDDLNAIDFADADHGIIVGINRAYRTHDGGATWAFDTTLSERTFFYDVDLYHESLGFVVGMYGSILKYDTGELVGIDTEEIAAPTTFELFQNYPNPFNPTTTIRYELPQAAQVELTIYNVAGQVVQTLADARLPAGRYRVQWNGRDMGGQAVSTGIYLCRLTAGTSVQTIKMIYLK